MATLKDIRKRIVSVQNTQQITKAMKMVAASKLRKAQSDVEAARPYSEKLAALIGRLEADLGKINPAFSERGSKGKAVVLAINSDRGLCGGLNNNLNKKIAGKIGELGRAYEAVELAVVGRKAADFFRRSGLKFSRQYSDKRDFEYKQIVPALAEVLLEEYLEGKFDAVYLAFNRFRSVISQEATFKRLLPLESADRETGENENGVHYLFEPSVSEILEDLMKKSIVNQAFTAFLDNLASEQGARMAAMDAATNNAGEVIAGLTLQYNRARQAAITKELIEIISGAETIG